MTRRRDTSEARAPLRPEGTFVIQLRSDSDLTRRRVGGRVEHVMSGYSEQFTSLAGLLNFMNRHADTGVAPTSTGAAKGKEDRHDEK